MMKLSDYVWSRLAEAGVRHVFMVAGGGAMHLNDSLGQEERIRYICNHHEQACAMAAEGYSRVTGRIGVLNVTSGPGGINALNGVFGAWTDSIPMLVLSGQVKRETCLRYHGLFNLRQLGDQEADIIALAQHLTKYAVFVDDPQQIRYHLERALHLATTGRPGPCWLDIPLDVQAAQIDETALPGYDPAEDPLPWDLEALPEHVAEVVERLHRAERPVILAGSGIRQAHAVELFRKLLPELGVPVVLSRTAKDLLPAEDPHYCGRGGIDADRAGNFVVRNADVLLVIGSRLGVRQTGYNWDSFAPGAYRIHVDADPNELTKPSAAAHLPLCYDAGLFLEEMRRQLESAPGPVRGQWLDWCRALPRRYPGVAECHRECLSPLNPYHFLEHLFGCLSPEEVVICANGAAFIMACQVADLQPDQRLFFNSGCASMGWDLPAAVGAAVAQDGKRVVCLAGDGSLQMNVQEMQTAAHHQLPIKLFVLNNHGYLSIRVTQESFFGRFVGESEASGMSTPDFVQVAGAYGWTAYRLDGEHGDETIRRTLETPGPVLCEVAVDPRQEFEPRSRSKQLPDGRIISPPLEDMYPFLDREELVDNVLSGEEDDGVTASTAVPDSSGADLEALLAETVEAAQVRESSAFDQAAGHWGDHLVLYGAGDQGRKVARALQSFGVKLLVFADRNAHVWGQRVEGIPVVSPEQAAREFGQQAAVVVTVWNPTFDYGQTERELRELGCQVVLPLPPLVWKYAEALLPGLFFDLPHRILQQAAAIRDAFGLFSDSLSRRLFVSQLRLHMHGDPRGLETTADHVQYFPPELLPLPSEGVFLDVGAFDGDMLRGFLALGTGGLYVGLEPDPVNFARLRPYVRTLPATTQERVTLIDSAASDRRQKLRFGRAGTPSAGATADGAVQVQALPLDELCLPDRVVCLKMDVEGAENEALGGAAGTVVRDQPALAVSLYHRTEALWRLPGKVRELLPSHSLYLRRYANCGFELVMYAIPPGRAPNVPGGAGATE